MFTSSLNVIQDADLFNINIPRKLLCNEKANNIPLRNELPVRLADAKESRWEVGNARDGVQVG